MRVNNFLGIVYANVHDEFIPLLTKKRSMSSVPFGARYRLIDFQLSNLVNAGISKVGIITNSNYRSLMDHVGSGRFWDLDRKRGGLKVLPPFNTAEAGIYTSHIEALNGTMSFIKSCKEEYVVLCDADVVGNFDFAKGIKQHLKTGADITMFYANGKLPKNNNDVAVLTVNEEKRVTEMNFMAQADNVSYSLDIMVLRRDLLIKLVEKANYEGLTGLCRDILMPNLNEFKVYGFEVTNYVRVIDSMKSYVEANMALLDDDVRKDVFTPDRPLLTKNRDDMPTRYGINSKVTNSIVADGCIINGTVKNCIIFRGVNVEEGSVVEDSILMQDTKIGKNCVVKHVITDKRVMIYDDSTVKGEQEKYKFLEKESTHY